MYLNIDDIFTKRVFLDGFVPILDSFNDSFLADPDFGIEK